MSDFQVIVMLVALAICMIPFIPLIASFLIHPLLGVVVAAFYIYGLILYLDDRARSKRGAAMNEKRMSRPLPKPPPPMTAEQEEQELRRAVYRYQQTQPWLYNRHGER